MSNSPPYMRLYVADYLADTRRLSTLEHGAYLLLIMEYWRQGGLPTNTDQLALIAGFSANDKRWQNVCVALSSFFDENWRHKRIDEELQKAQDKSLKCAFAASKSPRNHKKLRSISRRNADASQTSTYIRHQNISTSSTVSLSREALLVIEKKPT